MRPWALYKCVLYCSLWNLSLGFKTCPDSSYYSATHIPHTHSVVYVTTQCLTTTSRYCIETAKWIKLGMWVPPTIRALPSTALSQTLNLADCSALSPRHVHRRQCRRFSSTVATWNLSKAWSCSWSCQIDIFASYEWCYSYIWKLEALGQCIPPPRHVLPVPPSGNSVWTADLCSLTTFRISQQW